MVSSKKKRKGKYAKKGAESAKRGIDQRSMLLKRKREKRKVYKTTKFRREKTLRKARNPQYLKKFRNVVLTQNRFDKYDVLKYPVATEAVTKHIEDQNTIVFVCDKRANKKLIKKAFSEMFDCKVVKVRTMITPAGDKKAHIKLHPEDPAMEIATKINIL